MLSQQGGIAPTARRRSLLPLTLAEREDISSRWASRGIERLKPITRPGESALRPQACLLALQVKLQKIVASKLILDWSPEQISGWPKNQYPEDESMRVSQETIYRSLFI